MKVSRRVIASIGYLVLATMPSVLIAEPNHSALKFEQVADKAGIGYERVRSNRDRIMDEFKARSVIPASDMVNGVLKPRGTPGVVIFDADGDGDEDIYVTNGPGMANSLYLNQLKESGHLSFIDKGLDSGLGVTDQDSAGACYGDIDNDGDEDILVLGTCEESRLFENQGDGTFMDITFKTEFASAKSCTSGCSMGDIDNDGLLDVVVANTYSDWTNWLPFFGTWDRNEHNRVYKNMGDNVFSDISETSGIENIVGFRSSNGYVPELDGNATLTWAIALVDYDLDGDLDIFHADDQASPQDSGSGFVDRGFIRIFENDGTGHFTDVTVSKGTDVVGRWMGFGFGDLNCDGSMDFFATSTGDYWPFDPVRKFSSRWFLGNSNGVFSDTAYGDTWIPSAFGWGAGLIDYDNDADQDVVYHGSMDAVFSIDATNPGVFLKNKNCTAEMEIDTSVRSITDHQRRNVQGMAVGDLNNDGFSDVVSVSSKNAPEYLQLVSYGRSLNSPLDSAGFFSSYTQNENGDFMWTGNEYLNGDLSVEVNNAANRNNWIKVKLVGAKGIVDKGIVNRDGIGAIVFSETSYGKRTMKPVVGGGGTYLSQDSLYTMFGLGKSHKVDLEVLWPGGARNRIYNVNANQTLTLPEVPCSYDGQWSSYKEYSHCVKVSLDQLEQEGVIKRSDSKMLYKSARRAYSEHNYRH